VFERIDRLAQSIFNHTSFRSFLEWARERDFLVRSRGGPRKPSTASGAAGGGGRLGGDIDSPVLTAAPGASHAAKKVDSEGIIREIQALLAVVDPNKSNNPADNRSLSSLSSLRSLGSGSIQTDGSSRVTKTAGKQVAPLSLLLNATHSMGPDPSQPATLPCSGRPRRTPATTRGPTPQPPTPRPGGTV
jgi:hypothetical protein